MLKEVNEKLINKMEKDGKSQDFILGKTLTEIDESKTEYNYKNSTVTFFVKDSKRSEKKDELKNGHKIEVKFTDLTGRYGKDYRNITQSVFDKSGSDYEEFQKNRIALAKEMLRDCKKYQGNITVYKSENVLIEAIGSDLVKSIKNNTLQQSNDLNNKINYNHSNDRQVEITIRENNEKLGLKQGDKIIVSPTPYHFFGTNKKTRYKEALDMIENLNDNKDKIFIKKEGKDKLKLKDFLEQENGNYKGTCKDIDSLLPKKDSDVNLTSNSSIYTTKNIENVQNIIETVALNALYKTDYIVRAENKTR